MHLSIIIVNWNSKDYLENCIASIVANTRSIKFEIVVIDNASFDGCESMLRDHYPHVRFIQNRNNLGFARANNQAFLSSQGDSVLFLNPDTELSGPAIDIMHDYLQSLPNPGAIGCRLLNSDLSLQTSCIQSFPTILNQILDADALRQRFPASRLWGTSSFSQQAETPAEVDGVSGACLMVKRSVFEAVGMFSTHYFMYSEDIDLCFKIRSFGWKNFFIPAAVVIHYGGGSTERTEVSTFSNVMTLESRWRFFDSNRSTFYALLYRLCMVIVSTCRILVLMLLGRATLHTRNGVVFQVAFKKWISRLRWSVGLESWTKDFQA